MGDLAVLVAQLDEIGRLAPAVLERLRALAALPAAAAAQPAQASGPVSLTVSACCRRFGIGRRQVIAAVASGRLPAARCTARGGVASYRIATAAADQFFTGAQPPHNEE
jgi:hypothetical protein